jgi:hypothetical protein
MMFNEFLPSLIIGIAILGYLTWRFKDEIYMKFKYIDSEGMIENWAKTTIKGQERFHPMIKARINGQLVKFKAGEFCEDHPMYPVGTRVVIRSHPKKIELRKVIYPKPL